MSIIGSNILAGASGQGVGAGYTIERSLRLRSSASAYLSRTPASAGDRKTWTWSGWVKRGALGDAIFFSAGTATSDVGSLQFVSDSIRVFDRVSSSNSTNCLTNAVFRDPSAWYHVVVVYDNTQATASDRVKVYVNAISQSFSSPTYPNQNYASSNFNKAVQHNIGRAGYSSGYFDGYLTEVNFIDGQALTPSDFGEYNEDTGVWQPVAYSGTYGTNGFYLPFSDATTTTTLAADSSGNGNDWTPNNISLTSGVTYDSMTDTPTIYADGGNYAVLNPVNATSAAGTSLSNGNLQINGIGTGNVNAWIGTLGVSSGKWYYEVIMGENNGVVGISQTGNPNTYPGGDATSYGYSTSTKYNNNTSASYGASLTAGDVVGCAYDLDAGTITFYKNGVSQGQAYSGLSGNYFPAVRAGSTGAAVSVNFGQRPFAYTPPTGFLPLHTGNLPDSTIVDGSQYFDATLYTGTGAAGLSVTNAGSMQPDLVWIKRRDAAGNNNLMGSYAANTYLVSNLTNAEAPVSFSFDANGFSTNTTNASWNASGGTYVGWQWKANGAGVSNTDGAITSTVSANPTAGFSIVTYTGTGANATVGHGLGANADVVLLKARSRVDNWIVWHKTFASGANFMRLNTTASLASSAVVWNSTAPTSSVISLGTNSAVNLSGDTYVAYCFAEVEGYSKFGSYTGNGSPDGPFVYLGFKPKFVLHKRSDSSGDWYIWDSEREPNNYKRLAIWPNYANPENDYAGTQVWDFVSNGMKARTNSVINNTGSANYIYMAFAENPFKNSLAG